jgi:hypothetical protein
MTQTGIEQVEIIYAIAQQCIVGRIARRTDRHEPLPAIGPADVWKFLYPEGEDPVKRVHGVRICLLSLVSGLVLVRGARAVSMTGSGEGSRLGMAASCAWSLAEKPLRLCGGYRPMGRVATVCPAGAFAPTLRRTQRTHGQDTRARAPRPTHGFSDGGSPVQLYPPPIDSPHLLAAPTHLRKICHTTD